MRSCFVVEVTFNPKVIIPRKDSKAATHGQV